MGGNALKSVGARRVDRKEAKDVELRFYGLMAKIADKYGAVLKMELVPSYREKPSFGDLDFVLDNRFYEKVSREMLVEEIGDFFGKKIESYRGGDVFGIGFPLEEGCLQIDLIGTSTELFKPAIHYFAWNDLGNLVGRIAHKFGFKFGHEGLSIVLRDDTHQFAEILVTRNIIDILEFLGYDARRYFMGFDTVEDIYSFASSSKYFNKAIYELDNRNHIARTRERKRPVYMAFLEWLKNPPEGVAEFQFPENKDDNLPMLFARFPHVEKEYRAKWLELEHAKYVKTRFNATLVTQLTGLEKERLGAFMKTFKLVSKPMLDKLHEVTDTQLHAAILDHQKRLEAEEREVGRILTNYQQNSPRNTSAAVEEVLSGLSSEAVRPQGPRPRLTQAQTDKYYEIVYRREASRHQMALFERVFTVIATDIGNKYLGETTAFILERLEGINFEIKDAIRKELDDFREKAGRHIPLEKVLWSLKVQGDALVPAVFPEQLQLLEIGKSSLDVFFVQPDQLQLLLEEEWRKEQSNAKA